MPLSSFGHDQHSDSEPSCSGRWSCREEPLFHLNTVTVFCVSVTAEVPRRPGESRVLEAASKSKQQSLQPRPRAPCLTYPSLQQGQGMARVVLGSWTGEEDGHAEVSVRRTRTENRRAGGAGLGLGGKSWAGEARVTGVQGRHFRAPRWRSWSGTSLRNRAAIRSGLQVKKGLSTDRAAEQGPAETRHWRGSRPERQEVNSTTMKNVSPSSC